ncbi:vesicle-associated protein 2-2-like isoform X2 [Panicum virgatum]|uniref:MSP domain-containing protein n=1 Tax=Panicum virgatum TaxID=38727 RepID=A0A8T0V0M3_PANVG|nr:vesicle-associated protein 2-2-like isoform X2 [Panicum virgatum]KAG2627997.1 hypothetical protein PVAP13_3KG267128 [Panicum virgatum]
MGSEDVLVEIHPCELRFLFEVKKQSSCCVHLVNKSDQYVAFKVKTTSPKRYCVRPNVGVILPLASCDFTVTMQAVKNAPPDLQIKDKFLVQTTVVPFGTADEDIVPAFFSKESDRYIEEKKLKVVLVSMTKPQVEQHINGVSHAKETVGVPVTEETLDNVKEVPVVMNEVSDPLKARFSPLRGKPATVSETPAPVKEYPTVLQDFLVPSNQSSFTLSESAPNLQETSSTSVESQFASTETSVDLKSPQLEYAPAPSEVPSLSDIESTNTDNIHISHVTEDVHTLQMKLNNLGVKLEEAETLILNLREATRATIQERDKLRKEMVFLKRAGASQGQSSTGFPLLFVLYMAVVGMWLGYLLHL